MLKKILPVKLLLISTQLKMTTQVLEKLVEVKEEVKEVIPVKPRKGAGCSKSGNKYERDVYNVCKDILLDGKVFCTLLETELGGSSAKNDIECNFKSDKDLSIEIKRCNTPDWMQLSIKPDDDDVWKSGERNKIPNKACKLIESIIKKEKLFNGKIPPFLERKMTHKEWKEEKSETEDFNDVYIPCKPNTIARLYGYKKCKYIQISDYGLYHLGEDVCDFGVPYFECDQRLRIRIKIHKTSDKDGYMSASVMVAAQPVNIKKLQKSPYSLDDFDRLPKSLIKIKNE